MTGRSVGLRIIAYSVTVLFAVMIFLSGCGKKEDRPAKGDDNVNIMVITEKEEEPLPEIKEQAEETLPTEKGEVFRARYLGVQGYGNKETNSDNKDDFIYIFEEEGKERLLPITYDEDYSVQNRLKEQYVYDVTVSDGEITGVSECPPETTGYVPPVTGIPGEKTLTNFLKTAMEPMGTVLYIYGGGWDWQDEESSVQARTLGVSDDWIRFFNENDASYTYKEKDGDPDKADPASSYYPYGGFNEYYYAGLDCSGYLGWTLYNTFETGDGADGYVSASTKMAKNLAESGYGTWTQAVGKPSGRKDSSFLPGCIMSLNGHVWISLGTCEDGSVLISHSTPSPSREGQPGGGVQLGAIGNDRTCEAYKLADKYMSEYFPRWYERYAVSLKDPAAYFSFNGEKAGLFTWDTKGGFTDPDNVTDMTPEEVLALLFHD
ncbi:MAG: hypothetical protein K5886_10935 [Lachnospiraceae bacterium]|nr:hypothetical protein [Lachnospiraceae bacterium]